MYQRRKDHGSDKDSLLAVAGKKHITLDIDFETFSVLFPFKLNDEIKDRSIPNNIITNSIQKRKIEDFKPAEVNVIEKKRKIFQNNNT